MSCPLKPYYQDNAVTIYHGDCREIVPTLGRFSLLLTDPPYGLRFMGKAWDYDVPDTDLWRVMWDALKPGAHLLAFAGTRTQHRMACAIEDAGFDIRDMIAWVYGSGFPKSANVSKQLDKQEQTRWFNVIKALDNTSHMSIMDAWKENLNTASNAGLSFQRSETATGMNTLKSGSVPAHVLLQANHENNDALVVIAELSLNEAHRTRGKDCNSVPSTAESSIMESKSHATTAERLPESREASLDMPGFSALQNAQEWHAENTTGKLKAAEALKTWLGSKKSSSKADTNALCAALTDDLKHIILSQSKTFQSFDTTRQMECASAINATITEYTAERLISFTADMLRNKAIDKAAGAERGGESPHPTNKCKGGQWCNCQSLDATGRYSPTKHPAITAPATPEAQQWQGWGTALKPAMEPITVARKPFKGTVAANVLQHGTGVLNVDGCRVGTESGDYNHSGNNGIADNRSVYGAFENGNKSAPHAQGRFPANLIHDGSDEVVGLFPVTHARGNITPTKRMQSGGTWSANGSHFGIGPDGPIDSGDSGSAARFFYCAKASKSERGADNTHPTVKPLKLMQYLITLGLPPDGVLLDPFAGSGTTGRAAKDLGRKAVLIEHEERYCEIAARRMAQDVLPLRGVDTTPTGDSV